MSAGEAVVQLGCDPVSRALVRVRDRRNSRRERHVIERHPAQIHDGNERTVHDPSQDEDLAHVQRFLAGDESGFRLLFDKYAEQVHRLAYRFVRNREDADDLTQEVFLRVYRSLPNFQANAKFFTWLYRITVNRSIDYTRSRKANLSREVDQTFLEAQHETLPGRNSVEDPAHRVEQQEAVGKVAEALDTISEKHRAVFVLHAMENLSYKKIAEVLDINVGTVMSRLHYSRKKLRERLSQLGLEAPHARDEAT